MITHTITTDTEGGATFQCTATDDAPCHVWADCLSEEGCASDSKSCKHEKVAHDHCIYSEWWSTPEDIACMHIDEHGNMDVTPKPNMVDAPIEIEWDECPLWSFAAGDTV